MSPDVSSRSFNFEQNIFSYQNLLWRVIMRKLGEHSYPGCSACVCVCVCTRTHTCMGVLRDVLSHPLAAPEHLSRKLITLRSLEKRLIHSKLLWWWRAQSLRAGLGLVCGHLGKPEQQQSWALQARPTHLRQDSWADLGHFLTLTFFPGPFAWGKCSWPLKGVAIISQPHISDVKKFPCSDVNVDAVRIKS